VPDTAAPQPALVVDEVKAGSVPKILAELLQPAKGRRVEIGKVFEGYAAAYEAEGLRALTPDQFIDPTQRLCQECSIQARVVGKRVYLLDVRLVGGMAKPIGVQHQV
jgi:hypothetical protein